MIEFLPIPSRRLDLRRFRAEDLEEFAAYRADPVLARYQGWSPMSEEEARAFLGEQARQPFGEPGQWLQIAIALRDGGGLIGDLGVRLLKSEPDVAELGYTLTQPAQGHGYATEAVGALLDALFGRVGVRQVLATTDARNRPSMALLRRLEFRHEHMEQTRFRGEICTEHTFEIGAAEWSRMQRPSFLHAAGRRLECRWIRPAPGSARTLVFLHEGLGSVSAWRDFPDRLAQAAGCGALLYSRAGYGGSDPAALPRPIRFMHEEAEVLAEVLEGSEIEGAVLVGHSDGASIALLHAGSGHAPRIRGLILEAPHVFAEPVGLESIARLTEAYGSTDLRARLARHHGPDTDATFRGWSDVWLHPKFRDWNIEACLPAIRVPMLVLQGDQDEYGTWRHVEAIQRQAGAPVEARLLKPCGHAPHRDQPEAALEAMSGFIRRLFGQGPAPG